MKSNMDIIGRIFSSGVLGIILFLAALFLYGILFPASPRHDVVEGWAAGFFMIIAVVFSMFVSGALAMFLTFDNVSSSRYALAIPFLSGLVTATLPLLIVIFLGIFSIGLLIIGLIAIMFSLLIAESGGLIVFIILKLTNSKRMKNH